jgi:tetratricopeptide (TPR) repeat protein
MRLAPLVDSLESVIKTSDNPETELALANAYYDGEYWDKALALYEHYLDHDPNNINARIDYAYSITQVTGDFKLAITEIEKALAVDPEHVQGLFNAGILSLRANINDKEAALKSARSYFIRAKTASAKQGNAQMSAQIDEILKEMDRVAKEPTPAR